jgi:hypothetical protein
MGRLFQNSSHIGKDLYNQIWKVRDVMDTELREPGDFAFYTTCYDWLRSAWMTFHFIRNTEIRMGSHPEGSERN